MSFKAIAAISFGLIEGGICMPNEIVEVVVSGGYAYADGQGAIETGGCMLDILIDYASKEFPGGRCCTIGICVGQYGDQFLTPVTCNEVSFSWQELTQGAGDPGEGLVAFFVAIVVVVCLEVIDIDHQQ